MPCWPPASLRLCLYIRGGEYFVTHEVQPLNSCEFPNFSIIPPSTPPAPPSGEWPAFMEQYSAIDVHWIAAAPDHRFLWWTRSRCLFSSACLDVVCGFTAVWQRCGSSAFTMRQSGEPSGFGDFSHQAASWRGGRATLHAGCMCFSPPIPYVRACPYVFRGSRCVSAFNKGPRARREHTTPSDKFLAFAAGWSIHAGNLIPPINKGAAPSNRQRRKQKSPTVAFRRIINAFHLIYQAERLYVQLYVFVSVQSMVFILFISVWACFSLRVNTLCLWVLGSRRRMSGAVQWIKSTGQGILRQVHLNHFRQTLRCTIILYRGVATRPYEKGAWKSPHIPTAINAAMAFIRREQGREAAGLRFVHNESSMSVFVCESKFQSASLTRH